MSVLFITECLIAQGFIIASLYFKLRKEKCVERITSALNFNLEKLRKKSALKALKISMWKMSLLIVWYFGVVILHYVIHVVIDGMDWLFFILIGIFLVNYLIQVYYIQISLIASAATILFKQINHQLMVCTTTLHVNHLFIL